MPSCMSERKDVYDKKQELIFTTVEELLWIVTYSKYRQNLTDGSNFSASKKYRASAGLVVALI